jgi:hypothetical protein
MNDKTLLLDEKLIDLLVRDESTINHVKYCLEKEGCEYCFDSYSYFNEVEDPLFHELRKNYLTAKENLIEYIESEAIHEIETVNYELDSKDEEEEEEENKCEYNDK